MTPAWLCLPPRIDSAPVLPVHTAAAYHGVDRIGCKPNFPTARTDRSHPPSNTGSGSRPSQGRGRESLAAPDTPARRGCPCTRIQHVPPFPSCGRPPRECPSPWPSSSSSPPPSSRPSSSPPRAGSHRSSSVVRADDRINASMIQAPAPSGPTLSSHTSSSFPPPPPPPHHSHRRPLVP